LKKKKVSVKPTEKKPKTEAPLIDIMGFGTTAQPTSVDPYNFSNTYQSVNSPTESQTQTKPVKKAVKTVKTKKTTKEAATADTKTKKVVKKKAAAPLDPNKKLIAQDTNVSVLTEIKVSPTEPNKVVAEIIIKATKALTGVKITLNTLPSNWSLIQAKPDSIASIGADKSEIFQMMFQLDKFVSSPKISATLVYNESNKLDLQIPLTASSFILPNKITKDQYASIVDTNNLSSNFTLQTANIKVTDGDQQQILIALAGLLHVQLIEALPNAATLYGKSIQGHHVALLVKTKNTGSMSVELKTTDPTLAASLIAEVTARFK